MTPSSESLYPATEKLCSRKDCHLAGVLQPASNFSRNKAMKHGLMSACLNCARIDKRKWETRNPEKMEALRERKRVDPKRRAAMAAYRALPQNRAISRKRCDDWAKNNKPRVRELSRAKRFRRFGVTEQWYHDTLAAQGGGCAICGLPPHPDRKHAIDHSHACCGYIRACDKCRRGILCPVCNTRLGILEMPDWRAKAEAYLAKW